MFEPDLKFSKIRYYFFKFFKVGIIGTWKTNLVVAVIGVSYLLVLKFPQVLFSSKIEYKGITVYSSENISEPFRFLEKTYALIQRSKIHNKSQKFNVYIVKSHAQYRFFAPFSPGSFGIYYPLIGSIFINKIDPVTKRVSRATDLRTRALYSVVSHEITHQMLNEDLGFYKFMRLPAWKNEGYSEYISGSTTISEQEGFSMIKKGEISKTGSGKYFLYAKVTSYLLKDRGISFDEFIKADFNWEELKKNYVSLIK